MPVHPSSVCTVGIHTYIVYLHDGIILQLDHTVLVSGWVKCKINSAFTLKLVSDDDK